jgi:thiamine monophosphate kinase
VHAEAAQQQLCLTVIGQMQPRQVAQTQVQFRLHGQPFALQKTGFQHFD